MKRAKTWVALLDSDEDDFIFWQHGFGLWADHLELKWFETPEDFLDVVKAPAHKPAALIMDGVVPRGQEPTMLEAFLKHPDVKGVGIFMLSQQYIDHEHQTFLDMGATDHLIKPNNHEELKHVVLRVSEHAGAYSY